MKKFTLFLVLLFGAFQLQAQDDDAYHELDVNLLYGPGYINNTMGMSLQNEVIYSFHEEFGVGANLTYTNTYEGLKNDIRRFDSPQDIGGYQEINNISLYSVGINGYYMPLKYYEHTIVLGTGFSFNFQDNNKAYADETGDESTLRIGNERLSDIGLNLAVKYTYNITDRFSLGINGYGIFYDHSSVAATLSLGFKVIEED
ncbi:MAG: hypothetical protein ACLFM7_12725 [Bacteroidales bacterium]